MNGDFRILGVIVLSIFALVSGCARADGGTPGGATSGATSGATNSATTSGTTAEPIETVGTVEAQSAPQNERSASDQPATPGGTVDSPLGGTSGVTLAATLATGDSTSQGQTRGGGELTTPTFVISTAVATSAGGTTGVSTLAPPTRVGAGSTLPEDALPLIIESVQSSTLGSGQLILNVTGTQINDCKKPFIVEQTLIETTIYVQIYQIVPPETRCARNILQYDENIPLAVPLTRGQVYTVDVNGLTLDLTAP